MTEMELLAGKSIRNIAHRIQNRPRHIRNRPARRDAASTTPLFPPTASPSNGLRFAP
jgi:hypothetical protein